MCLSILKDFSEAGCSAVAAFDFSFPLFKLLYSAMEPGILKEAIQRMGYELYMEKYALLLNTILELDETSGTSRMPKMVSFDFQSPLPGTRHERAISTS